MQYRRLGRTDLDVSLICLGTMTWGQQNTEAEGHEQMDYALDQGINFFDTAELYSIPPRAETQGSTERIIGSWFKSRGTRDKVILASKVVGRSENTWFRDDGSPAELSREQVSLLAYSPLAQGYLTGKYLDGARPAGARTTLFNRGQRYENPTAEAAIRKYIALAREFGLDPAQMALAFVNSRPFVTSNIIGATSMAQLKTDIASIEVTITPELEKRIDAIHVEHCNPCP